MIVENSADLGSKDQSRLNTSPRANSGGDAFYCLVGFVRRSVNLSRSPVPFPSEDGGICRSREAVYTLPAAPGNDTEN